MNAHANTTITRPALLYGEQGEALRRLNDDIQDNIGWLLSDLIGECRLFLYKADQEGASARTKAIA